MALVGMLAKGPIDFDWPGHALVDGYLEQTEALLDELHRSMTVKFSFPWSPDQPDPLSRGDFLREAFAYGGESAYPFQYRELAPRKYEADKEWLLANRGFVMEDASRLALALADLLSRRQMETLKSLPALPPEGWTMLPGFTFTARELADESGRSLELTEKVLQAFSFPLTGGNVDYRSLGDFNEANATPILRRRDGEYVLLHYGSLAEALYDAPFYWMAGDAGYFRSVGKRRGSFAELFSYERLVLVFGPQNVHANVRVFRNKQHEVGEIDVLVAFGGRAIVLQAKSKRLTMPARQGDDTAIRRDFQLAVQDAYDQARRCADALCEDGVSLLDAAGQAVRLDHALTLVHPVCVVTDHYPALSIQARKFLDWRESDTVTAPVVIDVFSLDAMTEMLSSPLHFLSYIDRRARFSDKVSFPHELTVLSYHLKQNLWVPDDLDFMMLEDDISADLDAAMAVRREGLPGSPTPEGILTRLLGTTVGRIIEEIQSQPSPVTMEIGLLLLQLNEESALNLGTAIDRLLMMASDDGKPHDFSIAFGRSSSGLTVHVSDISDQTARERLHAHCALRKYSQKANTWYGLVIGSNGDLRLGLQLSHPWTHSDEMEAVIGRALPKQPISVSRFVQGLSGRISRNEPCPCGSGSKFKKCCGR